MRKKNTETKRTFRQTLRAVFAVSAAAAVVGGMAYSLSYSYLQAEDDRVNRFTVDSVETEIIEEFEKPDKLTPDTEFTKKVQVKNTGDIACYVRVRVLPTYRPEAYQFDFDADGDLNGGAGWYHTGGADDWYYYKGVIEPGDTCPALMTEVKLLEDLTGEKPEDTQILVYHESIQAEGHTDCVDAFAR